MTVRSVRRPRHRCEVEWRYVRGEPGEVVECEECGRRWRYRAPGNPDYEGWRLTWGSFLGLHLLRRRRKP